MERTASLPFSMSAAPQVRDAFSAEALSVAVRLISKYTDVPTDFPDATLVWIGETSGLDGILTLERCGFSSFRLGRNRRLLSGRCLKKQIEVVNEYRSGVRGLQRTVGCRTQPGIPNFCRFIFCGNVA